MAKKYASLNTLQIFLDNLKNIFATQTSIDELSADVAYINDEDNENVESPDIETASVVVDAALSTTSANPVQNKVITEKINEIDEKIVQSDWNQNDETADDYVKNRTHYEGVEDIELFNDTVSGFEVMGGTIYAVQADNVFTPVQGQGYIATWDGTEYDVALSLSDGGFFYLGNENYVNFESGGDIPFAIIITGSVMFFATESTAESHTISIIQHAPTIHKLDPKYLPDDVKLPAVTTENNGQFLMVVDGAWAAATIENAEEVTY